MIFKKALKSLLCILTFFTIVTMHSMQQPNDPNELIGFLTKNGDTVSLKRKIAEQSGTISHLLGDVDDQTQEVIPLPISTAMFKSIKPLLKKNFKGSRLPQPDTQLSQQNLQQQYTQLSQQILQQQSDNALLKLIQTTNYLDCPPILEKCADVLAVRTFSKNSDLYIVSAFVWTKKMLQKLPNELLALIQQAYLKKSCDLFEHVHNPMQAEIKPITLTNNNGQIRSVHYDIDGKKIITQIDDDTVCYWDRETQQKTTLIDKTHWQSLASRNENRMLRDKMYFETSAYSPDGSTYATGGSDTVCIWDLNKKELLNHKKLSWQFRPKCMSYHPTLKKLAVGSGRRGEVVIFDMETMEVAHSLKTNDILVKNIEYAPDGRTLAISTIGNGSNSLKIWDLELKNCLKTIDVDYDTFVSPIICYSPNSQFLAYASSNKITIYETTNNYACIKDIKRGEKPLNNDEEQINSIQYTSDGKYLIGGLQDGTIKFWETSNYTCIKTLSYDRPVWSVAFNKNGSHMASISLGKRYPESHLVLWDISSLFLENIFKELNFEELLLITKVALAKKNNSKLEVCPLHTNELDAKAGIKISAIYANIPSQLKEKLEPYIRLNRSCKCTFLPIKVPGEKK